MEIFAKATPNKSLGGDGFLPFFLKYLGSRCIAPFIVPDEFLGNMKQSRAYNERAQTRLELYTFNVYSRKFYFSGQDPALAKRKKIR